MRKKPGRRQLPSWQNPPPIKPAPETAASIRRRALAATIHWRAGDRAAFRALIEEIGELGIGKETIVGLMLILSEALDADTADADVWLRQQIANVTALEITQEGSE